MHVALGAALAVTGLGAACVAWGVAEAHAFTVRNVTAPCLPPGQEPLRVLHLSDLHLTPGQRDKVRWVRSLAALAPDLVVVTGDNLGHLDALPAVTEALEPFAGVPGAFVFGSNDYFAPVAKSPLRYFKGPSSVGAEARELPTEQLRSMLLGLGWVDLNNERATVVAGARKLELVGLDDPHIGRDVMPARTGGATSDLKVALVHAPYARALGALRADGAAIAFAGHTHGGQVCLPLFGALVTNCDLDRKRAKGLWPWPGQVADADSMWLHVSAGVGAAPLMPVRFACRPEASLVTLTPTD